MTEILFARQTDVTTITNGALRFDVSQSLTGPQKTQAQTNIGLLPGIGLRIYGNGVFYVNGTSGNDSNTGTQSNPFKTIMACVNYVNLKIDPASGVTINVAAGTYTENVQIAQSLLGAGQGYWNFVGAGSGTTIIAPPSGSAFTCLDHGTGQCSGFTLTGTGSNSPAIEVHQIAIFDIGSDMVYGLGWSTHISTDTFASCNVLGNYTIAGSALIHINASENSVINLGDVVANIPSALTFTTFAQATNGAQIYANNGWTTTGAGVAGTTGQKYVNNGGLFITSGSVSPNTIFPGNSNGASVLYAESGGMAYPASPQAGAGRVLNSTGTASSAWTATPSMTNPIVAGGTSPVFATSSSITTGAGASTGTLTNAPAVGNPTKWIPINDNGTTRYIPAW